MWEVRYVRIEDNREDPAIPCCHRPDADPVDRDLSEQYIWGSSWNSGIHLHSDRISQSGLRTGIRSGSIEDDHYRICDLHGSDHWRVDRISHQ